MLIYDVLPEVERPGVEQGLATKALVHVAPMRRRAVPGRCPLPANGFMLDHGHRVAGVVVVVHVRPKAKLALVSLGK